MMRLGLSSAAAAAPTSLQHAPVLTTSEVFSPSRAAPVAAASSSLVDQKRFSFKYATKRQLNEMRQPDYIHDKRYGVFSNERNVGKARRGLPHITPMYTKHMNLWETDTDATTNRFFRPYVFGQRELHLLLGRPHQFESTEMGGKEGDSVYEREHDMRYKGAARPALLNSFYEPQWHYTLYQHGAPLLLNQPRSPFTEEVLGPELLALRDIKSKAEVEAWYARLSYLIDLHYEAVGDVGAFKSRHTQHVHTFFMAFYDALSHHDFQDRHLLEYLDAARPEKLSDLFAIFIEMENNYLHRDFCPRCSLPYATTRFCGEGDSETPFRRHRGRWAPHPKWGKEWTDVVVRRAEALWHRATEDPYFGTQRHTQRQVDAMLAIYVKTKQRGKLLDFVHHLRGSREFLYGEIRLSDAQEKTIQEVLDTTPHPHLLTNGFTVQRAAASLYLGASSNNSNTNNNNAVVPLSPLQVRIDLEMAKYRRQQKEEGVVRVPPAGWTLDTSSIVNYKTEEVKNKDSNEREVKIVNWREVREGIEQSFLNNGLREEHYSSAEWRELLFLKHAIATRGARRARLESQKQTEEEEAAARKAKNSSKSFMVFPDALWYRVFDTSAEGLKPFHVSAAGAYFTAGTKHSFLDPHKVLFQLTATNNNNNNNNNAPKEYTIDITKKATRPFGGYYFGDELLLSSSSTATNHNNNNNNNKQPASKEAVYKNEKVVVLGVHVGCPEAEQQLLVYAPQKQTIIELGSTIEKIQQKFSLLTVDGIDNNNNKEIKLKPKNYKDATDVLTSATHNALASQNKLIREEFVGQIVGVRHDTLYVQWRLSPDGSGGSAMDRSVAVPLGDAAFVAAHYRLQEVAPPATPSSSSSDVNINNNNNNKTSVALTLQEPPSWATPFRNDQLEEELRKVENAPFARERWTSLVAGKYTPKVKKYNYAQHNEVDDYETKEYKDRLLSKQFFHDPQRFAILPDRHDRSVSFCGKEGYRQLAGVPTVDRNELQKGQPYVEPISDDETAVIEQALRDISGSRGGNFIKSPTEASSLQLNEEWWAPLQVGWQQRNAAAQLAAAAAGGGGGSSQLVDPSRLPFQGKIPPFGTSYGMGERLRDITEDFRQSFGLGPHKKTMQNDFHRFDTLQSEEERVFKRLGFEQTLVRLFDEKCGREFQNDVHAWALQMARQQTQNNNHKSTSAAESNAKHILLSLHAWREKGQKPSLLLKKVLEKYLAPEIEVYNYGLPKDVPRLSILSSEDNNTPNEKTSDGNIWSTVDPFAYQQHYQQVKSSSGSGSGALAISEDEPYLFQIIQKALLTSQHFQDANYVQFLQQQLTANFTNQLADLVGKDVPPLLTQQKTIQQNRQNVRMAGNVSQLVRMSALSQLLTKFQVSTQTIAAVERGLLNSTEKTFISDANETNNNNNNNKNNNNMKPDFVIPVSFLLTWLGPNSNTSTNNNNNNNNQMNNNNNNNRYNNKPSSSMSVIAAIRDGGSSGSAQNQNSHHANSYSAAHALHELSVTDDGVAADILYAINQNKKNKILKNEFLTAFLPVYQNDYKKVLGLYHDYCDGKFVPNLTLAFEVFIHFLAEISSSPAAAATATTDTSDHHHQNTGYENKVVVPFFEREMLNASSTEALQTVFFHDGLIHNTNNNNNNNQNDYYYSQLKLLPPALGAFQFENTLLETMETVQLFQKYRIATGSAQVPMTGFISPESKAHHYFSFRNNNNNNNNNNQNNNKQQQVVYITTDNDHGLVQAVETSPAYESKIKKNKKLHFLLQQPHGAGLVATFHRYMYRVMPMLQTYAALAFGGDGHHLHHNMNHMNVLQQQNKNHNASLERILESERSVMIDRDFKRNAERYWRSVLEGKNMEEVMLLKQFNNNNNNNNNPNNNNMNNEYRPPQQQQQQQNNNNYNKFNSNNNNNNNKDGRNTKKKAPLTHSQSVNSLLSQIHKDKKKKN